MNKFIIWTKNYVPDVDSILNGEYKLRPSGMVFDRPWLLICPDGREFNEVSHSDAIMRMNIVINEVPA